MRTPISTLNLLGKRTQAVVSIMGVAFALLLIFMQLGFRGAVAGTATIVYGRLEFDVVLRSPEYLHLYETRTVPLSSLNLLAGHPDVESVRPFYIMLNKWQSPQDGNFRAIAMMGMRRDMPVIDIPKFTTNSTSSPTRITCSSIVLPAATTARRTARIQRRRQRSRS